MTISRGKAVGVAVTLLLVAGAWAGTWAQGLGQASDGSMAALTSEVRQLGVVIREAGQSQTQVQALNVFLTAQQSRLNQVSSRLDAAHVELMAAQEKLKEEQRLLAQTQAELAATTTPGDRTRLERDVRMYKYTHDLAAELESRLRLREQELMNQFRADEQRWLELVAKLEEIVKR